MRVREIYYEKCERAFYDGVNFNADFGGITYYRLPSGRWLRDGVAERVSVRSECVPSAVVNAYRTLNGSKELGKRGRQIIQRQSGISV